MSVIDDYLQHVEPQKRAELERIRKIIKQVAPTADEVISYGMPGFKFNNHYLIGFNALKQHIGIYPTSEPIEALRTKLEGFNLSKGTIRTTLDNPIPESLLKELVQFRMHSLSVSVLRQAARR